MTVPNIPLPPVFLQTPVEWTEIEIRCDATITVGSYEPGVEPSEWIKPGASGKVRFAGIPQEADIHLMYTYLQNGVVAPVLEDVITKYQARLVEQRRGA